MWMAILVLVGLSKAPMARPIQSLWIGSQKSEEPQVAQKPRRTFSDDWNQVTWSAPWMETAARGTSVETKTWPECLRHFVQWHASGGGSGTATSKLTAPQRQDPLCMARSFVDEPGQARRAARASLWATARLYAGRDAAARAM